MKKEQGTMKYEVRSFELMRKEGVMMDDPNMVFLLKEIQEGQVILFVEIFLVAVFIILACANRAFRK